MYSTDIFPDRFASFNGPIKSLRATCISSAAVMEAREVTVSTLWGLRRQILAVAKIVGSGKAYVFEAPGFAGWLKSVQAQDPGDVAQSLDAILAAGAAAIGAIESVVPVSGAGDILGLRWSAESIEEPLFGPDVTKALREALLALAALIG
jgi:hypothetical protein